VDDNETNSVVVTALPAGHCPGSVMLYFQNKYTNVLYTSDFRLKKIDIERIKPLKLLADSRTCDAIYFDSTFFSCQYKEFPPQHESINAIIDLIRPWLEKSTKHQIVLKTPATYGSELLFKKISKATNMKIHVNDAVYEQYRYIPDMDNCLTKSPVNPLQCRIHACYGPEKEACLKDYKNSKLLRIIRPSAMIWRYWNTGEDIVTKILSPTKDSSNKTETYRVCYSNHSSLSEIRDLLLYLKPKKVNLNVVNSGTKQEMFALKQQIMEEYNEERSLTAEAVHQPFVAIESSFTFATAQTLDTRIHTEQIEINEEFVLSLPKRRKRIE
jgi:DNA repair metallo-beta-lactamase